MNININLDNISFGQSDSVEKFLDAGIHENITMYDVKYDVSTPGGNKFICFYFQDEKNHKSSHTEYEPKPLTELPRGIELKPGETVDQVLKSLYEKKVSNSISRIGQILVSGGYITREQFPNVTSWDFESFCRQVVALLNNSGYKSKKVRAKFVYNKKGYTSLPQHVSRQFIESMNISKEDSKIQKLNHDVFTKPVADNENNSPNPYLDGNAAFTAIGGSDPF